MSQSDELRILVSSVEANCDTYQRLSGNTTGKPACTMTIPNQLLLEWSDSDSSIMLISKANDCILNEIITLKQTERLEKHLALLTRKMMAKVQQRQEENIKNYYKAVAQFMS